MPARAKAVTSVPEGRAALGSTVVHRTLWPAVVAIGRARESWQVERLSHDARNLLAEVDRKPVRTDRRVASRHRSSKQIFWFTVNNFIPKRGRMRGAWNRGITGQAGP